METFEKWYRRQAVQIFSSTTGAWVEFRVCNTEGIRERSTPQFEQLPSACVLQVIDYIKSGECDIPARVKTMASALLGQSFRCIDVRLY
jgi:hypothetical protein